MLAVLVEREPIKLAPNSAQIPALLAKTKQNIYQMRQAVAPAASAAASAAQTAPEANSAAGVPPQPEQPQVQILPRCSLACSQAQPTLGLCQACWVCAQPGCVTRALTVVKNACLTAYAHPSVGDKCFCVSSSSAAWCCGHQSRAGCWRSGLQPLLPMPLFQLQACSHAVPCMPGACMTGNKHTAAAVKAARRSRQPQE